MNDSAAPKSKPRKATPHEASAATPEPVILDAVVEPISVETPAEPVMQPIPEPVTEPTRESVSEPAFSPPSAPVIVKASNGKAAAIGGIVGAALASAVFLGAPIVLPKPPADPAILQQLTSLQSALQSNQAAVKANEAAVKALPALEKPVAALDARTKALEGKLASLGDVPSGGTADLSAYEARLAKLETAATAPKSENRIAVEPGAAKSESVAGLAVAAQALAQNVARGAPYDAEFAAVAALGGDKSKLEALKPFAATGLPSTSALVADLTAAAKPPAPPATEAPKSLWQRVTSGLSSVVKIRSKDAVSEPNIAAIATLTNNGALAEALALQAKLPEPLLGATKPWAEKLAARANAEVAAKGLWLDALSNLAKSKN